MKSYCLKCRKDTENINTRVSNTSNGRARILSKCAICGSKKLRFVKNQETKGLLSILGLRTPLSKVPISGNILFQMYKKMNKIVNTFLLAGDKSMPEIYLKQPRFTYSACGPFTKDKERIQKFKETGNTNCIYKNELDTIVFFYNSFLKKSLKDNDIEMYLIHNKGNSVVAERFIRTLKTKISKYMTSISFNFID